MNYVGACGFAIITIFTVFALTNNLMYEYANTKGTSMLPTIHEGDRLTIFKEPFAGTPHLNDIVTFSSEYCYSEYGSFSIAHRIININGTQFLPKGDNNSMPDCLMPLSAIEGIVIGVN